jgi:hypothetical protein
MILPTHLHVLLAMCAVRIEREIHPTGSVTSTGSHAAAAYPYPTATYPPHHPSAAHGAAQAPHMLRQPDHEPQQASAAAFPSGPSPQPQAPPNSTQARMAAWAADSNAPVTDQFFLGELKRLVQNIESLRPTLTAAYSTTASMPTTTVAAPPAAVTAGVPPRVNNYMSAMMPPGAAAAAAAATAMAPQNGRAAVSLQQTMEYLRQNRPPTLTLEAAMQRLQLLDL